jgi:hypothetical protein
MKSINAARLLSKNLTLLADEILEFHAARLLLLFKVCGENGRINGLTKMAKLDFFVRYPSFFTLACKALGKNAESKTDYVESSMVRYHYGPWDNRYYQILGYLEARGLLTVKREGKMFELSLTELGFEIADRLESNVVYGQLTEQMNQVHLAFGKMKGSQLKNLIYKIFDEQVAKLSMGDLIKP